MENLIKHGPLSPAPVKDQPNPSNLDSITDQDWAKQIAGHDVCLRWPLEEIRKANESSESKYGK
jgi:hypothetical protein